MTEREFIKYVKRECRRCNISFRLLDQYSTEKCAGYFDESRRLLVTCKRNDNWLHVLLHEYCHMSQWRDNSVEWQAIEYGDSDSYSLVDAWIDGESVRNINRHIDACKILEYDCECRALEYIDLLGLPIEKVQFIQRANAGISQYEVLKSTRAWHKKGNSPAYKYEVWSKMPQDKIIKDPPEWIKDLILKESYNQ